MQKYLFLGVDVVNSVGIDISKGKSMIAVARPFGEIVSKPFDVCHTSDRIAALANHMHTLDGDTRDRGGTYRQIL